jgi:hypothetical protein
VNEPGFPLFQFDPDSSAATAGAASAISRQLMALRINLDIRTWVPLLKEIHCIESSIPGLKFQFRCIDKRRVFIPESCASVTTIETKKGVPLARHPGSFQAG